MITESGSGRRLNDLKGVHWTNPYHRRTLDVMPMIKSQCFEERMIAMSLRHVVLRNAKNRIVAAREYDDLVFLLPTFV